MPRRVLTGSVVSARMSKTVVVRVTRLVRHPVYQKVIRRVTNFMAHDPGLSLRVGDEVRMEESRPLSRRKRWRVIQVLRRAVEEEASDLGEQAPASKEAG